MQDDDGIKQIRWNATGRMRFARTEIKKEKKGLFLFSPFYVASKGIEPLPKVPETFVLSIKLREQVEQ